MLRRLITGNSLRLSPISRLLCIERSSSFIHRLLNLRNFSEPPESVNPSITAPTRARSRTPLETEFESWVQKLKPGFTPADVDEALRAQSDPDLALDIFRWTALQRGYKHNDLSYLTTIQLLISGMRYRHAETLLEEVIAGACPPSVPLYNTIIRFCCGRKFLFNRAFDVYKKMLNSQDCKPTLETYSLLFTSLLRRFNKLNVCYVYLRGVRSLTKQMKTVGVVPDTFVLNLIIKAFSKCLEVDEAIRIFREMGLYGCVPNSFTYSYIVKGLCEKGRTGQGFLFYKEMGEKGLVPKGSAYAVLICSLALEARLEDAVKVVFDMLGNCKAPDILTYKTVLEELCRKGKCDDAFDLLEEWRKKDVKMGERIHKSLLNTLQVISRD